MQETYGIDVSQPGLLDARSVRWLKARIGGLLSTPFGYQVTEAGVLRLPVTRLQAVLYPAKIEEK
jgi:hypothetical protein